MFWAEIWKYQNFLSENFLFLVVKFSIYLNRRVFVMRQKLDHCSPIIFVRISFRGVGRKTQKSLKVFVNSYLKFSKTSKINKDTLSQCMTKRTEWHSPSLIRVFSVLIKKAWVLSYQLSAQQRRWSDWADAQADLSLRWAHMLFCWFCHALSHI